MAHTGCDTIRQDPSSHFSTSQLQHQPSTHSSHSGSSKRGFARIAKPPSASNSPHHIQRRRTTANHRLGTSPYQSQEQRTRRYYSSRYSMPYPRPMSWHPGSGIPGSNPPGLHTSEPVMGSTIEGLENLAMTATPTFAVQQCVENALAMGFGYPLTTPCSTNDSATLDTKTFTAHEAAAGPTYDFYASYDTSEQLAYPYLPQVPTPNPYAFSDYQTQPWAQPQQHLASISQYTHASSGFSSLQTTAESPEKVHSNTSPEVKRTGTRDLVGMGLYDNEDRDFMSTLNSAASTDPSRDSLGKGLKLEETWEPPKDDDVEEEEEEGYSTEEGEEMDDISPVQATIPPELHTALYPATYGDLSNQSFFFNDEDMFTSESSYGDYLHSQGYQEAAAAAQPKAADHAPGDFLWF